MNSITTLYSNSPARRPHGRSRALLAILACLVFYQLIPGLAGLSAAQAKSRIVIVVNDDPITSYEISQRIKLLTISPPPAFRKKRLNRRQLNKRLKKFAREELIEDTLKLQEAKRRNIKISSAEVDGQFAGIARNVKMSPKNFGRALRQRGIHPKTLKKRLRVQMVWQKLIRSRFRATVRISEQQVIASLSKSDDKDGSKKSIQYTLSKIVVVVPAGSSKKVTTQKLKQAEALRRRFTSCAEGILMSRQLNGVVITNTNKTTTHGQLPENTAKLVAETAVGRLTKPFRAPNGFEMLAVCDKKEIASTRDARSKLKGALRMKEGRMMARRYLRDLKRDAVIERR